MKSASRSKTKVFTYNKSKKYLNFDFLNKEFV